MLAIRRSYLLVGAASGLSGLLHWGAFQRVAGPIFSADTLRAVEGKSRAETLRLLGPPSNPRQVDEWIFERWPNPGYVQIRFDQAGRVNFVNDESPIPAASWEQPLF